VNATIAQLNATHDWWRPESQVDVPAALPRGNAAAFGALIAFTTILLVAPQEWFPAIRSLRIAFLAGGLAIVAHLAGRAFGGTRPLPVRHEMAIALALVLWAAFTIPLSIWPGGSWSQLTDHLIKAVVFFWLIGTLVTTRRQLELFAWVLALCSLPLAVTALDNYRSGVFVTHASSAVQRIAGYVGGSGLAGNPNDLALMLNLLLPITAALMVIARRPWLRAVAAAALVLSVAAVIATFSRAGFITLAVIAALGLWTMVRRGAAGTALIVVFLGIGAFFLMPSGYFARLSTITNIEADPTGSAQGRWSDYFLSIDYIRQHPLTGAGLGQDLLALNAARGHETWRSVHNAYLQAAVDLGIPGVALLLALLFGSFANTRRVRRRPTTPGLADLAVLAQGVQISLVAFAVAAFFHPIAYQFYFFCLAGLAVALVNAHRAEAAPAS
jgi:probable O-glycosylation ligase (exosortase A-associated)